jgi:erythromycin esterase-like protein
VAVTIAFLVWAGPDGDPKPFTDWARANAIPLATAEPGHGLADMEPLRKAIGDARIVALGEATHGTREFFQLKHRMVEFLATRMGFTVFSIEANMPESYRLNDYVLHGKGDPRELIKGMYFWTWDTEEVLAMVEWMREFNRSGKGRIEFTGFDMQFPDTAAGIVRTLVRKAEPGYEPAVAATYESVRRGMKGGSGPDFGVLTWTFPVEPARGKKVRYSGYIRTEAITRGWAGLWWRVDGEQRAIAFDNMMDRGPKGTTPWTRYEVALEVAPTATNINFGILHPGDGTAWFDSLSVELDGKPFDPAGRFDFDFEAGALAGAYAGGRGYRVELDQGASRSGKQSLRSRLGSADSTTEEPPDPRAVSDSCGGIVKHLEGRAATYRVRGIPAQQVEWAIQNARVLHQCAASQSGETSRDESMATNVRWILEHSPPKTKIVLWAHNGHVSVESHWRNRPMGAYLRDWYGQDMVVVGFAFNQGSFRAVQMGKGLREFTVAPAPAGSLDAALAATAIPVFAMDLRGAPKSGEVAEWLDSPKRTRSIGAMYSDSLASSYFADQRARQCYDMLLFVEKTAPARGIGRGSH